MRVISAFLIASVFLLQGCAVVTQNDSLAKRTAQSLGADPSEITISNVDKGLQRIDYQAKYNGAVYGCYVVVMLATSDAMCVKRGSGGNKNPLTN
ncbi:TPA: hypothetical protein ACKP1B_004201 [Serratia fonticola]